MVTMYIGGGGKAWTYVHSNTRNKALITSIHRKSFSQIVPALLQALQENEQVPRVQAHSAAALVNFSEECPKAVLAPYLQPLMERLEWVLESKFKQLAENRKMVLEQVITTIASVADASEEAFTPYYDR